MKKIVLIGNSFMSIAAIEEIRAYDTESEIVLFCPENILPYDRERLPLILNNTFSIKDIYCQQKNYFDEKNVRVILDKKIIKIHPKRKRLIFDNKEQESFDVLIIEDSGSVEPADVKGAKKQGVFLLHQAEEVDQVLKAESLSDVIIIQPQSLAMLQIAICLKKSNKEVIVVSQDNSLFSDSISLGAADFLEKHLKSLGIRVITNNAIVEVLGESEAKAVRLKTGKVLESQLVILEKAKKSLSLFSLDETLAERNNFYTKFEDIFIDSDVEISNKEKDSEEFLRESIASYEKGKMIASAILGSDQIYKKSFNKKDLMFDSLRMVVLGDLGLKDAIEYEEIDRLKQSYRKIFILDDVIKGVVLINSDCELLKIEGMIKNEINISQLTGHVLRLNYSVESAIVENVNCNLTEQIQEPIDSKDNPLEPSEEFEPNLQNDMSNPEY